MTQTVSTEEIALSYLRHEFRKLFLDVKDDRFWAVLDSSLKSLQSRIGKADFWQLVSGISEGLRLKWVYRILTNDRFTWSGEQIPLEKVRLTGMGPQIDELIKQAEGMPERFGSLYRSDVSFKKSVDALLTTPRDPDRDSDPILVREVDDRLSVFDGMRRILLAIIDGKPAIDAYVGRVSKTDGKMMVNPDKVYFLTLLFQESKNQEALKPHLVSIAREIIRQTRNGRDVWKDRIAGWTRDKKVKGLVKEILGENGGRQ